MTDLFTNLFKYLPSETVSPIENYLTEIFAYILKNSKLFRDNFFETFIIEDLTIKNKVKKEHILTQVYYLADKNSFFDIQILNDDYAIIIENKVDSDFGENQLQKYNEYLTEFPQETKFIITITKSIYENQNFSYADYTITWLDIYSKLLTDENISKYEKEYAELLTNLRHFLKENGMGLDKVTWDLSRGLVAENNLINMIESVTKELCHSEYKELKCGNIKNQHYSTLGFYSEITITKENKQLTFYYILNKVSIYAGTDKNNLVSFDKFEDLFWDNRRVEITQYNILKERFLGLDVNEQCIELKKWIKSAIEVFLKKIK